MLGIKSKSVAIAMVFLALGQKGKAEKRRRSKFQTDRLE